MRECPAHAWWLRRPAIEEHEADEDLNEDEGDRGEHGIGRRTGAAAGVHQQRRYTTLGWLKFTNHPLFRFYALQYLHFIRIALTDWWGAIQCGTNEQALRCWQKVFEVLELDRKACADIMLLAHSGLVGRVKANQLLWNLLSNIALKPDYRDLSHKVTNLVNWAKQSFQRPPRRSEDLRWWRWS